jgi:putative endonuclease
MSRARGSAAEQLACRHLQAAGLHLRESNYHCRFGELDLIMQAGETLVFVEVRQRRSSRFGSGADSIDHRKRQRLLAAASHYLQRLPQLPPCRFDVVAIDGDNHIDWIIGAFDAGV